ncbi:MAG TPA: FHA domain-containing protein [Planctomycetaceae bacterium]
MKPNYAPQRRRLLALDPQPSCAERGLSVRPAIELPADAQRQAALSLPEMAHNLGDPLQPFFDACGGRQTISLVIQHRSGQPSFETCVFQQPFVLIGRCPENDLVLAGESVGFRHIYLQLHAGCWMYANLDSLSRTSSAKGGRSTGWLDVGCELDVGSYTIKRVVHDPLLPTGSTVLSTRSTLPAFELELINGRSSSRGKRSRTISESMTLIGAAPQCDLCLRDDGVSKVHASLVLTENGAWVVDLLGRDGVLVNDRPAYWKQLHDGDVMQIGRFRFRTRFGSSSERHAGQSGNQNAARSEPEPRRESSSGGSLSDASVLALFDRIGDMQSQFLEHSQIQMQVIANLLTHLDRNQQVSVRADLARIDDLSRELDQVKSELAGKANKAPPRPARTRRTPAPKKRSRAAEQPRQDVAAAGAMTPDPSKLVASVAPDEAAASVPGVEDARAGMGTATGSEPALQERGPSGLQPSCGEQPASDPPALSASQASLESHARLTQRMANLARERNSVWRRVLDTFGGKPQDQSSQ